MALQFFGMFSVAFVLFVLLCWTTIMLTEHGEDGGKFDNLIVASFCAAIISVIGMFVSLACVMWW